MQPGVTISIILVGVSCGNHLSAITENPTSYVQCGENEEYSTCIPDSYYQKTCSHYSKNIEPENYPYCQSGCKCKPGYVREITSSYYFSGVKCVRVETCAILDPDNLNNLATPCYRENERFNFCSSPCDDSCDSPPRSSSELAPECLVCEAKCECLPGYIRQSKGGECIPEDACPRDHIPCNENESYSFCGSVTTCEDFYYGIYGAPVETEKTCTEGCYCNSGFVRNPAGKCVEFHHCPIQLPVDCTAQNNLTVTLSARGKRFKCDDDVFDTVQSYSYTYDPIYSGNWCPIVPEYSPLPLSGDISVSVPTYYSSSKPYSQTQCASLQSSECAKALRKRFQDGPISFNDAVNEIKACRALKFQCNDDYCNIDAPTCDAATPGDLILSIGSDVAHCTKDGLFKAKQSSPLGYRWCALVPDLSPKPLSPDHIFRADDFPESLESDFTASCEQMINSQCAREVRRMVHLKKMDVDDAIEKSPRCDQLKKKCTGWSCGKQKTCGNQHLWSICAHGQHGCSQKCGVSSIYGPSETITNCVNQCKAECECLSGYREDRSQACVPPPNCNTTTQTTCETERQFNMENLVLFSRNSAGVPIPMTTANMNPPFIPTCNEDGSYAPIQGHANVNLQWCALVPDLSTEPLSVDHMFSGKSVKSHFSQALFEKTCEKIQNSDCATSVRQLMGSGMAFKRAVAMTKSCAELAKDCSGYRCNGDGTDPVVTTSAPKTTDFTPQITTRTTSEPKAALEFSRLPELKCSEMAKAFDSRNKQDFGNVYYSPSCNKKGSYDGLQSIAATGDIWCPLVKDRHPAPLHKGYTFVYDGKSKIDVMKLRHNCEKLQKSKCSKTVQKALDMGACLEKAVKVKECKKFMAFDLASTYTACETEFRNDKHVNCTSDGRFSMVQQRDGLFWCVDPDAACSESKFVEVRSYIRPTEAECRQVLAKMTGGKGAKKFKKLCKMIDKNLVYGQCARATPVTCGTRGVAATAKCERRCACKKGYVFNMKKAKCMKEKFCLE